MMTFIFSVYVFTRYITESGVDTDGCGESAETACRTMSPLLTQLLLQPKDKYIIHDPEVKLDEIWNKMIYPMIYPNLSNWQGYWKNDNSKLFEVNLLSEILCIDLIIGTHISRNPQNYVT